MQNQRPRVMWIPLILMGSIVYWSVALGLGRMSLSLLGDTNDEELVNCPGSRSISAVTLPSTHTTGPVEVQIINEKKVEFTGSGGNHALDDGTGRLPAIDDSPATPLLDDSARVPQAPTLDEPPGRTSF